MFLAASRGVWRQRKVFPDGPGLDATSRKSSEQPEAPLHLAAARRLDPVAGEAQAVAAGGPGGIERLAGLNLPVPEKYEELSSAES